MSFPSYPKYKASGVEWLGDVPDHWEVKRLDFLASVKARLGWKGLTASEYVPEGYVFLATPNIKGQGEIDFANVNYITAERYYESPEIMVQVGDVLMAKDGSTLGTTNVVHHLPAPTTVNSSIAVLRPKPNLNSSYFFRWLTSAYLQSLIQSMKDGQGVPHLFQADIRKFAVLLPELPEQTAIAEFLDRETGKIDELVAEQRRLMELLKEKRQAVISHAVTKGLNPHAPMKPSGIEWLGEVPAGWEVLKLKHLTVSIEQGWSPQCEGRPVETDEEWGVLKVGCVNGGVFRPSENKLLPLEMEPIPALGICKGDLLISRANTRELVGSAAVAELDCPNLLLCDKLYRLRFNSERCLPEFVCCYLGSLPVREQIELRATGASASMVNIPQSAILELKIAAPSLREQTAIMAFLETELAKFDTLTAEAQRAIDLLQERRTALISAAVTGQIDVRQHPKN